MANQNTQYGPLAQAAGEFAMQRMEETSRKRAGMTPQQVEQLDRQQFQKDQDRRQQQMTAMDPNKSKGMDPFTRERTLSNEKVMGLDRKDYDSVMANMDGYLASAEERKARLENIGKAAREKVNGDNGSGKITVTNQGTASRPEVTAPTAPAPTQAPAQQLVNHGPQSATPTYGTTSPTKKKLVPYSQLA